MPDAPLPLFNDSYLSDRARTLKPSVIRKFFDMASRMKDPVDLSIGQPHFEVPDIAKAAAMDAIRDGRNRYSPTAGLPELREKMLEHLRRTRHIDTAGSQMLITEGTCGGLLLTYLSLLGPGDDVLIPDPWFVLYVGQSRICGCNPVTYDTGSDFRVRVEELEKARTPDTKVVIINSPQNPTGVVYNEAELRAVAEWAREHKLFVISDEVYDLFVYDEPHVSIKKFYPEGTIVVGAFSKSYGMPGWRVGWALLPDVLFDKALAFQMYTYVCAPTPLQVGCMAALDADLSATIADYRRKRDLVYEGLKDHYPVTKPGGSFYIYPAVPEALRESFMDRIIERELLVVPSQAFSMREELTHFRLSFAADDAKLQRGLGILREIAESV
ncbi:MAG: pyridoxal phosphate-dependent aminotransferase [Planctomycetota bacterium]